MVGHRVAKRSLQGRHVEIHSGNERHQCVREEGNREGRQRRSLLVSTISTDRTEADERISTIISTLWRGVPQRTTSNRREIPSIVHQEYPRDPASVRPSKGNRRRPQLLAAEGSSAHHKQPLRNKCAIVESTDRLRSIQASSSILLRAVDRAPHQHRGEPGHHHRPNRPSTRAWHQTNQSTRRWARRTSVSSASIPRRRRDRRVDGSSIERRVDGSSIERRRGDRRK